MENSRAIVSGVQYLCLEQDEDKTSIERVLNANYYLENYARFLQFQKVLEKNGAVYRFSDGELERIQGMVRLKRQLNSILHPDDVGQEKIKANVPEDMHRELLTKIKAVTGAENGELIVPYQGRKTPI